MKFKVVITDYTYRSLENERAILEPIGAEVVDGRCISDEDIIEKASDADALVTQRLRIPSRVIDRLPRCLAIVRYAVGTETIDIEAATRNGICVANVPDYGTQEVANHAIALIMSLQRQLANFDRAVRNGGWGYKSIPVPIHRMAGKVLGIVGFGRIGRAVGSMATGLGFKVVVYDPNLDAGIIRGLGAEPVTFEELLNSADFISLHLPIMPETRHMLGEREFALMKPGVYIVNVSRGQIIDEMALVNALRTGRIAGAGLDVFEEEPINKDNPLLGVDNVILTPHVGWYSEEAMRDMQVKAAQEVRRVLEGGWPLAFVNPSVKSHARLLKLNKHQPHGT